LEKFAKTLEDISDSLSDLEEEPDPTSGRFSIARRDHAETLTTTAQTRGKVQADQRAAAATSTAAPTPAPGTPLPHCHQMRPARYRTEALVVNFFSAGGPGTSGTLSNISSGGLQIRTTRPTDLDRLVRLEIIEEAGAQPLRIAGQVTWSNPEDTSEREAGFAVRILHFLSARDEQHWDAFLEEQRIKNNSGVYARPG
jgi:hypothetical protein